MHANFRLLFILPAVALSGCAVMAPSPTITPDPLMNNPAAVTTPGMAAPAVTTANAASMTDISAYVDPAALKQLSGKSRDEAASAQYNALQFGRVGAPRNWVGDNGASGAVTVGPYIRVNLVDCRDFTHIVTIAGAAYVKKGTACRETDGSWTVTADADG